jgi:hypothetical protein
LQGCLWGNHRNLRGFPKTPRLPRAGWQNLPSEQHSRPEIAFRIVIASMNPFRGRLASACLPAVPDASFDSASTRHAMCFSPNREKNFSRPVRRSVDFFSPTAKPDPWRHGRPVNRDDSFGSFLQENNSTHGHSGRPVVPAAVPRRHAAPSVVIRPFCEAVLPQRPIVFGPGVRAALTQHPSTADRIPAHANRIMRATRPRDSAMRRAASCPTVLAGMSGGRERRTQPWPSHASANGHESMPFFHGDYFAQGSAWSEPVGFVSRS